MNRNHTRLAAANPLWIALAAGALAVVVLVALLIWISKPPAGAKTTGLVMYCAAGVRVPVEQIAAAFNREYGVQVEMQYGGSNTLLSQIEVNRDGPADLYLAGDQFYTELAGSKGLAAETVPIAAMRPVIAVPKANPKSIRSVDDLLRSEVKVALANPDQAAIGRATRDVLSGNGNPTRWEQLSDRVTSTGVFKPTVSEVANDIKIGAVDAGIIWDATAAMPAYRDHIDVVRVPEFQAAPNTVTIAVLKSSRAPTAALRFARYLTARDQGLPTFAQYGYDVVEGDLWAWQPEITFFCGSVNRRAVDDVIKAFAQREGVTVNTVYNGCGILTGQMRTINTEQGGKGFPDVYMACDRYYLQNVANWFQEDVDVSDADIVIAVPKGNPKGLQRLADLTRPGVRVAVGQPQQCTIGALTRTLLEKEGLYDAVMANVVMQTASSAMLVPGVTTRSVDAAIAYVTDTIAEQDKVDLVRIASPYAKAVQPFGIARSSDHKHLGRRLFQAVAHARDKFESAGFNFRIGSAPATQQEADGS